MYKRPKSQALPALITKRACMQGSIGTARPCFACWPATQLVNRLKGACNKFYDPDQKITKTLGGGTHSPLSPSALS
jgi:hypothetical protein